MSEKEKKPAANRPEEQLDSRTEFYYTVKSLTSVLVVLVLVFTFVARIILVDGASMEPTLLDNEVMLVRSLGYRPKQGDVVVLAKDGFHNGDAIVKRIIATGGQHVEIDYNAGAVFVDGVELDEPYIKEFMVQQFYQTITDIEVPEGSIFVMGDNRNNSDDSRNLQLGTVEENLVLGEAMFVLFPFSRFKLL